MSGDRALVRNAADPQQVRRAERKTRDLERQYLEALREVMHTYAGRHVMRTQLEHAGIFRSIWDPSSRIHYNAGQQDAGHRLQAELVQADEDAYELMEREARARQKALDRETDAAHTPRAEQQGDAQL